MTLAPNEIEEQEQKKGEDKVLRLRGGLTYLALDYAHIDFLDVTLMNAVAVVPGLILGHFAVEDCGLFMRVLCLKEEFHDLTLEA